MLIRVDKALSTDNSVARGRSRKRELRRNELSKLKFLPASFEVKSLVLFSLTTRETDFCETPGEAEEVARTAARTR